MIKAFKDQPETRMKINIAKALSNKVAEVFRDYQTAQIQYKSALKEKITRQSKQADPTLDQDKERMQDILNDPQVFIKLFIK